MKKEAVLVLVMVFLWKKINFKKKKGFGSEKYIFTIFIRLNNSKKCQNGGAGGVIVIIGDICVATKVF